jgi:microcystin-dependent protein
MSIADNEALYSLIGTTYGGDGLVTFSLPDLRGRVPVHYGQGAGIQNILLGETGGMESVTLTTAQMPAHNHGAQADPATSTATFKVSSANPSQGTATNGASLTIRGGTATDYIPTFVDTTANTPLNPATITPGISLPTTAQGGSNPHPNMMPFLALNYIIAIGGIYPPQP